MQKKQLNNNLFHPAAHRTPLTSHLMTTDIMIAEIIFNLPLERSFHYFIPPELRPNIQPGMRAIVPFGRNPKVGFVTRLMEESPIQNLKPLRRLIDPLPVIAQERWELATWLSHYYYCSLGEALFAMVPSSLRLRLTAPSQTTQGSSTSSTPGTTPYSLTVHQNQALQAIERALSNRQVSQKPEVVLLHGVTGSGKTEIYLQAIAKILKQGGGAICLIPEISLTPQTIERFRERFGSLVAVWHSRLSDRSRSLAWQSLADAQCRIVIGARSAIFAPISALRLIILDEEQERTYKQEDAPRYHAREVALERARLTGAAVILGSATPSIESYFHAKRGDFQLIRLPQRIEGRPLPSVEIIDMREEIKRRHRRGPLSSRLERAIQETVEQNQQAMLLLNRRGFARVAQCQSCGNVLRCPQCQVPLVFHASKQQLVCHYCSKREVPPEHCPQCQTGYLQFRGTGTERIESELHRLFPTAAIGRMDRDTTKGRSSHEEIYEALKNRQIGLLVGTQMIAKGFDLPHVTLAGIVSADTALNLPDFRAGEWTFDLLTQMAGRAGRGNSPGHVLIQTYCPGHYAIQAAVQHDYETFYAQEIEMRQQLGLPPLKHLIQLTCRHTHRARVYKIAQELYQQLQASLNRKGIQLLGPAPHRILKLRGAYQLCLLMKGGSVKVMVEGLRQVLGPGRRFRGIPVTVDVDPL